MPVCIAAPDYPRHAVCVPVRALVLSTLSSRQCPLSGETRHTPAPVTLQPRCIGERGGACGWAAWAPPPQKARVSGAMRALAPTVTPRGHHRSSGCSWPGRTCQGCPPPAQARPPPGTEDTRRALARPKGWGSPRPQGLQDPGTAGPASEQRGCSTVFDLQTGERGTDWCCFTAHPVLVGNTALGSECLSMRGDM